MLYPVELTAQVRGPTAYSAAGTAPRGPRRRTGPARGRSPSRPCCASPSSSAGSRLLGALAWAASVGPSGPSPAATSPPPAPPTSSARPPAPPPVPPPRPPAESSSGEGAVRGGPRLVAGRSSSTIPRRSRRCPRRRRTTGCRSHAEDGQTFEEFRTAPRRIPTQERHTLRVRPLDDVAAFGVPVALLSEHLAAFYGVPVRRHGPRDAAGVHDADGRPWASPRT